VKYIFLLFLFCTPFFISAQKELAGKKVVENFVTKGGDVFGTQKAFIQNIGQYDVLQTTYNTDKVLYAYEGLGMPVLLTKTGLVHVQRKYVPRHEEEEENSNDDEEEKWTPVEKAVTMKWIGANLNPNIVSEGAVEQHFTYGFLLTPAKAVKKLRFQKIYPGVDLHFSFDNSHKAGMEFSLRVQPGYDISAVKWKYGGDVKKIVLDSKGNLIVYSSIDTTVLSAPKAFYTDNKTIKVPVKFRVAGNVVGFVLPSGYDKSRTLVIDPFISTTSNLTGNNASIAKDIDFDYEGNIYVGGGGNVSVYMLAKYDANGVHQWTFNGGPIVITGSPNWNFGLNYGGFMVDKTTGKTYLSQGWNTQGVRVARLSTTGVYDNYISSPNVAFSEGWRLIWDCNNGNSKMLVAGGGSTSNLDFGVFSPPSVTMNTQNITGLANFSQDIADAIIDPRNHELYTIFSHGHQAPNDMYKHVPPYAVANIQWNKSSGFTNILLERQNRPYLGAGGNDNSINTLALNSSYLFYWDGKNLKAFNKSTGNVVGTPLVSADTVLRQGGIIADECGNVFVGARSGTIKVYKFDGNSFNDAAATDINVPGFNNNNSVYDLAYDDARRTLYVSGRGFVASFDITAYCAQATYQVQLSKNCTALSVTATLVPAPPVGSTLNYILFSNGTQISSNNTGIFTGLTSGASYTIKAFINQTCSGIQTAIDFVMGGPPLSIVQTPACGTNGSITITATGGSTPYSYSIDGVSFQPGNVFNNLTASTNNITVKDAAGCVSTAIAVVDAGNNCVQASIGIVDENCATANGSITVTATQGTPPYTYSINGTNFQSSNVFNNLTAGNYTVTVKDASNGTITVPAIIGLVSNNNLGSTYLSTNGTCAGNDGSIFITGTGGTQPFEFRSGNGAYQSNGLFSNLTAGDYTITVKDANGCTFSQTATIRLTNNLTVDAGNNQVICEGDSVALNATSIGNNFSWTPAVGLSNISVLQPKASPAATTKYYLTAKLGPCTAIDSTIVDVKPAPRPFAEDTIICYGQSVMLNATGGASYTWAPSTYLNSTIVANPLVTKPTSSITYTINSTGTNNCISVVPGKVTVTVDHSLRIFAGNDTVALENDPLQLNAIAFNGNPNTWLWSPAIGLSNATINNPVFISDRDVAYQLMAITADGCEAQDSIYIKVYKFEDIFVPTAFSPNSDGKNELLKAVPVGVREFKRFSVYNRWGQLVFTTTDYTRGWDGRIGGVLQSTGVFVWIATGVDFRGRPIERKGTSVLIR
jgi:gliding motility-associated-like protein